MNYFEQPAHKLAQLIAERKASSVEIVTGFLARIAAINPTIGAVVQVFDKEALAAARRADAVRNPTAALHGVPFTAKDVFDVDGQISSAGLTERRQFRPRATALAVQRLVAAGGILMGKTNCPPGGAGGESVNEVYGRTLNPYRLDRTPGGSSGGEAALIAAQASPLGLGSDSGGSLRFPAHCCGVYSLKPTTGRIPNTGAYQHPGGLTDPRTQIGPLARSVQDLELAYGVLAGADASDTGTVPVPITLSSTALARLGRRPRLGFFTSDGDQEPAAEIAAAVRLAADLLGSDLEVREVSSPYDARSSLDISRRYWSSTELSGKERDDLLTDWDEFRRSLALAFSQADIFLGPVCARTAPPHGEVSDKTFQYTLPYSLLGNPCLTVPVMVGCEGLPIGVQLAAAPWREDLLLAIGILLEQKLHPLPAPGL
jgi:amidase